MGRIGRDRGLDRERIVAAAFEQIEIDGAERFSMRKLGARLGVDPMAIYYHVSNKGELLDAMVIAVYDEIDVGTLPWEADGTTIVTTFAQRFRAVLRRHPAMVTVVATRPMLDERQLRMAERAVARLAEDGYTPTQALTLVRSAQALTIGLVLADTVYAVGGDTASADEVAEQIISQDLETMAAATEEGPRPGSAFDEALSALLDGFAHQRGPS